MPPSIIYVFRVMTCDAFYGDAHPSASSSPADRCARREIDSATASQVSLLGMSTSVCGIVNLFICGALIHRFGTRWAFVSQTGLLAVRVACQIMAVAVGGKNGIILMQATQLVGIVGGPRGYMYVVLQCTSSSPPALLLRRGRSDQVWFNSIMHANVRFDV